MESTRAMGPSGLAAARFDCLTPAAGSGTGPTVERMASSPMSEAKVRCAF